VKMRPNWPANHMMVHCITWWYESVRKVWHDMARPCDYVIDFEFLMHFLGISSLGFC
jgi:hypothetical protein